MSGALGKPAQPTGRARDMIYKGLKAKEGAKRVQKSLDCYKQGFLWSELVQINTGSVKYHEKKDCELETLGYQ